MVIKEKQFKASVIVNKRVLYQQNNNVAGVTLVCIGGIHGNEPAGIYGLNKVINTLKANKIELNGNFYALSGNISALQKGQRFQTKDLNRLWTQERINSIKGSHFQDQEDKEQYELYTTIKTILSEHSGKVVFVDLHTTSSETIPFITISDSLENRELAAKFSMPIVLGIEEYLDGPLLTYINEFGHTSLGFEAGQHQDIASIENCEAFIWSVLEHTNLLKHTKSSILSNKNTEKHSNSLDGFFEIIYRHEIKISDSFKMQKGFKNFEEVSFGQPLALHNNEVILANSNGFVFMPLYQKQGSDGFFIARRISSFWLRISKVLRRNKLHNLLKVLPGVSQHPEHNYALIVNKKIATLLTTKVFHLFGYRKRIIKQGKLHFIKRDRKISKFR